MTLRTIVVFSADFPNDGVWAPNGDEVCPPGCNIASALVSSLKDKRLDVTEPKQLESYGWYFTVSGIVRFVLQFPGPWLLLSKNKGPLIQKVLNSKRLALVHRDILETVNALLHQDGRFHDIRWITNEDYDRGKHRDKNAWHSEP